MEVGLTGQRELAARDRVWIAVFVFAFLGLMVDGADLMFLSYSLSSLKQEFGLSNVQAGRSAASRWRAWPSAASMAAGPPTASAACAQWSGPSSSSRSARRHSA